MKKLITIGILLLTWIQLGYYNQVEAVTVSDELSIPYVARTDLTQVNSFKGLGLVNISSINPKDSVIDISVNKVFNFVNDKNGNVGLTSTLNIGNTLTTKVKDTTGSYSFVDFMGVNSESLGSYSLTEYIHEWINSSAYNLFVTKVFEAEDTNAVKITSDNPNIVSCTNSGCKAENAGTAKITVSFPETTQEGSSQTDCSYVDESVANYPGRGSGFVRITAQAIGNLIYGNSSGYGKVKACGVIGRDDDTTTNVRTATYSFPSIEYTITVPGTANENQVVACSGIDSVTTEGANIKWSYTDKENDLQTNYQIQIATDSGFNTIVKSVNAPNNTNVSEIRNAEVFGLEASTKYYARVKAKNDTNLWSEYSTCGDGFTTEDETDTNTDAFSVSCSAPSISENQTATFTAKPLNNVGPVTYQWKESDGTLIKNETSSTFKRRYTEEGSYKLYVSATNEDVTQTNSCRVTVNCEGDSCGGGFDEDIDGECGTAAFTCKTPGRVIDDSTSGTVSTWVCKGSNDGEDSKMCIFDSRKKGDEDLTPVMTDFYFKPDTVSTGKKCPLYVKVSNTTSCSLYNRSNFPTALPVSLDGIVNINGEKEMPVGTYRLECYGVGDKVEKPAILGTQSCYSNPDISED